MMFSGDFSELDLSEGPQESCCLVLSETSLVVIPEQPYSKGF
jgi:hypothetical protein